VLAGPWASGPRAAEECGKLASVQNEVETKPAAAGGWEPSTLNQLLFELDRVRTGEASRAAILYSDQTLHRINEKSEVEVVAPQAGNPGVVRVISGQHYFSARKPKDYGRIETPTVTAAIRGTEFVVDVVDGGTTTITMIEGVVDASNAFGSIQVGAGEAAFVEPGKAPVKQIVVRPRDAVMWSLYYPRVLGGADARRLGEMGADGQSLAHAAELLSAGQVNQAEPLIEQARERNPKDPIALALASVIDVAADRTQEAMSLASEAVAADPNSAAAALAMSFASQAGYDLAEATRMAENAARLDPGSAEALARVAELRMAAGDTQGAKDAAERAVRRDPNSVRALTVLGFVQLAELKSDEAVQTFESAVQTEPSFPLAHLGLGIARIRRGNLTEGREELQTAVILDPDNSLFRSYLSKAYYEEKREDAASKELAEAKQLDPSDPTPYLYDAMLKQVYNRPVEALKDIQTSIELNDRRAVYRSRLLLDQDLAVRSADLASVYNELGFEQLGMVAARASADMDQSNYSAHNFLAGNYRGLPGFAPAFLSEALQARIYQPVNVNAVRPDIVNESVSFNEYTSLLDRPRLRGFAGYTYGDTDTDLSDLYDPGDICLLPDGSAGPCEEVVEVNGDSNPYGGDVTLSFNRDRFAGAVAYRDYQADGFRVNNDVATDSLRGFFVFAPTYRDQFQVNVIDGHRESGDLPLRDFPAVVGLERVETDLTNVAVGYHRIISPAADLAISAIYTDTTQDLSIPLFGLSSSAQLKGPQIEGQYVLKQANVSWIAGGGYFDGEQDVSSAIVGLPGASETGNDTFANAYVYAKLPSLGPVDITAGVSYEDLLAPIGLLPPRDSLMIVGDVEYEDSQFSPKLGISAQATPKTVVRATAYSRLSPAISRLQTLEPTQVAGFNQFFDDPAGTSSFNYGVGLDQEFTRSFFAGFSVLRRDLEIPEPTCATPDAGAWCSLQPAVGVEQRTSDDWLAGVYLNGTAGKRVALGLQYGYEERDFDFIQISNNSLFEDYVETQRVRPEVRLFLPMGFFAVVRATYYNQTVDQFDDLTSSTRSSIDSEFTIGDLGVGYRLPKRWGTVALNAFNITDREFDFYRSSLEEDIVPARTIALTVNFASP
jgi:tetratricopeptide (TPR) repeat protein